MKPEEEDPNKVGIRFGLQPQSRAEYDRVYGVTSSKLVNALLCLLRLNNCIYTS